MKPECVLVVGRAVGVELGVRRSECSARWVENRQVLHAEALPWAATLRRLLLILLRIGSEESETGYFRTSGMSYVYYTLQLVKVSKVPLFFYFVIFH